MLGARSASQPAAAARHSSSHAASVALRKYGSGTIIPTLPKAHRAGWAGYTRRRAISGADGYRNDRSVRPRPPDDGAPRSAASRLGQRYHAQLSALAGDDRRGDPHRDVDP